jgi:hypothetical protein
VRTVKRDATLDPAAILKFEAVVTCRPRIYLHSGRIIDPARCKSFLEVGIVPAGVHYLEQLYEPDPRDHTRNCLPMVYFSASNRYSSFINLTFMPYHHV